MGATERMRRDTGPPPDFTPFSKCMRSLPHLTQGEAEWREIATPELSGGLGGDGLISHALIFISSDDGIRVKASIQFGFFPAISSELVLDGQPYESEVGIGLVPCITVRYWDGKAIVSES